MVISPIILIFLYLTLTSYSGGINGQSVAGCTCHAATSSAATLVSITGLPPGGYTNGTVYSLTISVTNTSIIASTPFGLRDGFDLTASSGAFTPITGTALNGATEIRHNTPKTVVSGTASWTFNWTAPATGSANVTFNLAGNATNGNGNNVGDQWNKITTVLTKALPLSVSAISSPAILCNGGTTTITASSINGVAPIQFKLNAGTYQSISSFPSTPAGTYTITAKDALNVTATTILTISQPTPIAINSFTINNPICNGGTGSVTMSATGGIGTKTFTITPLGPQTNTSGNFSSLTAQAYTITVTDANSCSVTTSFSITQPAPLVVSANNVSGCSGHPIALSGSPAGGSFSVAHPYTGPSTTYVYTYVNGVGCSASSTPATITVTPVTTSNIVTSGSGPACQTLTQSLGTNSYVNTNCQMIASINASSLGATDVCVDFLPGFPTWNGEPYAARVYSIIPTIQPAVSANVCLYYTASDLATAGISNPSEISITKVGGNGVLGGSGSVQEILNSSMIINNLSGGITEVCFPVSSFSSFYLHSKNPNNIPLPVSYLNFDVVKDVNSDEIQWTSAIEYQNLKFEIEQSMDGHTFTTIGEIQSKAEAGNSSQPLHYHFSNTKITIGKCYYRLKQIDFNGNFSYSEVKEMYRDEISSNVYIYPNPTSGEFTIDIHEPITIRIFDMSGRMVYQQKTSQTQVVNLAQTGIYMVQLLKANGISESTKLIVNSTK